MSRTPNFVEHFVLLLAVILSTSEVFAMKYPFPSKLSFNIRQAFNLPGIKDFFKVDRNPRLCLPSVDLISLNDLDCTYLKRSGIRAVIFDKDNTLRLVNVISYLHFTSSNAFQYIV